MTSRSKKPINLHKEAWKATYRAMRIYRHEAEKAMIDTLIYGQGYVQVKDGEARHIPFEELLHVH